MTDALSPALCADLDFALSGWGLTVPQVPRDHEGHSITDRLRMVVAEGRSHRHGEFRCTDLRNAHTDVWTLFPENPQTVHLQEQLAAELHTLLAQERTFRTPPHVCTVRGEGLPLPDHAAELEGLLRFIDEPTGTLTCSPRLWPSLSLFEDAQRLAPALRAAAHAAATRAALVAELASGELPPQSAACVRRALDSDADGLHNADITLAGYQVVVARLRDNVALTLTALHAHLTVAERIRTVRDTLERTGNALHWPGPWQTAPRRV